MKRTLLAVALLSSACVSGPERSSPRGGDPIVPVTLADQAARQADASRPGKEHRALDPLVGAWITTSVAVDANGREGDPVTGRAAIDWSLNGHYLRIDANLEMPGGGTHTWSGFLGFDQASDEYQWIMVSDLSTGMGVAKGRGEVSHGGIRFVLDVVDPRTGALSRATSVLRVLEKGHLALEQIGIDPTGLERVLRRTHYRPPTK